MPDHVALTSDASILFPWDRQVYSDARWQPHPETVEALRLQNLQSDQTYFDKVTFENQGQLW